MRILPLILVLALLIPVGVQGARYMNIYIEGPTLVAAGTNHTYRITLSVFFLEEEPKRYGIDAWISGQDLKGAEPVSPVSVESNESTVFQVSFKFPEDPGTVTIHVIGYVVGESGRVYTDESSLSVNVVEPVILRANLRNDNDFPVENITVEFYVDGQRVGEVFVDRIGANSNKTVEYRWAVVHLSKGWHKVIVKTVGPASYLIPGTEYSFYYGKPSTGLIEALLWAFTLGLLSFFGYMTFKARRRR